MKAKVKNKIFLFTGALFLWAGAVELRAQSVAIILVKFHARPARETIAQEAQRLGAPGQDEKALRKLLVSQHGLTSTGAIPVLGVERLQVPTGKNPSEVMQALGDSALVEFSEANHMRRAFSVLPNGPDDPIYKNGYVISGQTVFPWWLSAMEADRVYAEGLLPYGAPVIVAVLDTGILLTHPEFTGRLTAGADFIHPGAEGNDDSASGHGTAVAGVIGAAAGNHIGIAGAAGAAHILLMPVKVLDDQGSGDDFTIAQGIIWAADHGARVINLSLGGTEEGKVLETAVHYAYQRGCVLAAAAGNDAYDDQGRAWNPKQYPAAYPEVIAVAACDDQGEPAVYSEHHRYVDLAAPGGTGDSVRRMIISTSNTGGYTAMMGTSLACPMVSAAAAVLLAKQPERTPAEVENILITTAKKTGALGRQAEAWNESLGWGEVNLYQALARAATFVPKPRGAATYNYPNPFQPAFHEQTNIVLPVSAAMTADVHLSIFNDLGRRVRLMDYSGLSVWPGKIISWDGRNDQGAPAANGVYPYVLEIQGARYRNKIVVLNR